MINIDLRSKYYKEIKTFLLENFQEKNILELVSDDSLNDFNEYYFYFPFLFEGGFKSLDKKSLKLLNIAGFLCFKQVIMQDKINDNQLPQEKVEAYSNMSQSLVSKAVTELQKLYPQDSLFWKKWQKRKKELLESDLLDSNLRSQDYSYEKYENLAWGKSAFAKLAIDGLFELEGHVSVENYNILLQSHKDFSCAMQLFDDVLDIKEDQNSQFNIAKYLTERELIKNQFDIKNIKVSELENYLYVLGVAVQIYTLAVKHIDNALENTKSLNVKPWHNVLNFYKAVYKSAIESTNTYLEIIKAETFNSHVNYLDGKNFNSLHEKHLNQSYKKATDFVISRQNLDGSWSEYLTSAGTSTVWATGFILFFLPDYKYEQERKDALAFLLKNDRPLWGYKSNYINDTDSSFFAVICLLLSNHDVKCYSDMVLKRQNNDAGFSTYTVKEINLLREVMKKKNEQSYAGWIQSHACVTSVGFLLTNILIEKGFPISQKSIYDYFNNKIDKEISLSYWWTDDIYTLFFLSQSAQYISNDKFLGKLYGLMQKKLQKQNNDGSFGDKYEPSSAFYTGLMALTMINLKKIINENETTKLESSIIWLIKNQKSDGSWIETNALKIPMPDDMDSNDCNWPVSQFECKVRAPEYNRLFTTAICCKAVSEYLNFKNEHYRSSHLAS